MNMHRWNGTLTRQAAIALLDSVTDQDDPYWENLVYDYYDEEIVDIPHVRRARCHGGRIQEATGAQNVNWPENA